MKKVWMVGGLASVAFALGCTAEKPRSAPAPEVVRVAVMQVAPASLPHYYEAVGTVRSAQMAQVSAQVAGNIVRVNVREGDRVSAGQVLATIDDAATRAGLDRALAGQQASAEEVAAANTELALAESTLKRYEVLRDKKSVSAHEFEEVQARYAGAKARRDMAQAGTAGAAAAVAQAHLSQGYTRIRAPFAGVVTAKYAEAGNLANPGTPLFTVEDTSSYRLEVPVDESQIGTVELGSKVDVTIDALGGDDVVARVVQILPSADAASRSFLVKLEIPKGTVVRSGLFGRARFPVDVREGYALPRTAIISRGSMQAVYAVGGDEIATLRYVTLGSPVEGGYEVLSGIEKGDRVVRDPGDRELNGKKVEVR